MNTDVLKEILTDIEIKIYLVLLKEGNSLASDISKKTGIHRRTIYDAIERLIEKGLVSYIKTNNRKYFEAVDPARLSEILKEKEENVNKIIPELENLRLIAKEKKETLFFRGKQSLKSVFDDQIRMGKEILILGDAVNVNEILKYYFFKFDKERVNKKIPIRMIFDESAKGKLKKIPLSKIKFIDKKYNSDMSVYIYGNNTAIVSWSDNPSAILIKEKAISDGFRGYFEFIWK
ncbi:winged helix-turn-helix transcriptional regulator [Candidatus Woesearchaeota archaeon]|nr:winged helix-turn-helix transcriptional regulator [Candidatus Woesearchaeota archaeon]